MMAKLLCENASNVRTYSLDINGNYVDDAKKQPGIIFLDNTLRLYVDDVSMSIDNNVVYGQSVSLQMNALNIPIYTARTAVAAFACIELVRCAIEGSKELNLFDEAEFLHNAELFAVGKIYKAHGKVTTYQKQNITEDDFTNLLGQWNAKTPKPDPFAQIAKECIYPPIVVSE